MDILTLKITNFMGIGDAPEINLHDQGLVLIQGINEDDTSASSNGVGKSSIADALCWVLYGETAREETGDAVVNDTAKKNCCVVAVIRDGSNYYQIRRYRKHKEFKNQTVVEVRSSETAVWVDISKGIERETQTLIRDVMGCSLDVFMAAIYAGQEVTPDLPKMTDKQLKLLIEEAAGVERLEAAYEVARGKLNSAKTELVAGTTRLEHCKTQLSRAELDHASKQIESDAFDSGREERAQVFVGNAEARKTILLKIGNEIKASGDETFKTRREDIGVQLSEHATNMAKGDVLKRGLADARIAHDRAMTEAARLMNVAVGLKNALDNAEVEVTKPCRACGKPGGDVADVDAFKAHTKAELMKAAQEAKDKRDEVTDAMAYVCTNELYVHNFEATIPDVSALNAEQRELTVEIARIASLKSDFALEKKQYDRVIELKNTVLTETNPHSSAIEMLKNRVSELRDAAAIHTLAIGNLESEVSVFEGVSKVFSPSGVRAHILDTVTPFLNDRTSDYLSVMSDGNISAVWNTLSTTAKGEMKEKFNIEVSNDKGAKSFKGLSGGEKRKVRLASMLALQDLVSSRATKPINLWMGDEIDEALDDSGLERLMSILERKARERGTVLVISHNSLKDWCDSVLTVTKSGGSSTFEGAMVK